MFKIPYRHPTAMLGMSSDLQHFENTPRKLNLRKVPAGVRQSRGANKVWQQESVWWLQKKARTDGKNASPREACSTKYLFRLHVLLCLLARALCRQSTSPHCAGRSAGMARSSCIVSPVLPVPLPSRVVTRSHFGSRLKCPNRPHGLIASQRQRGYSRDVCAKCDGHGSRDDAAYEIREKTGSLPSARDG